MDDYFLVVDLCWSRRWSTSTSDRDNGGIEDWIPTWFWVSVDDSFAWDDILLSHSPVEHPNFLGRNRDQTYTCVLKKSYTLRGPLIAVPVHNAFMKLECTFIPFIWMKPDMWYAVWIITDLEQFSVREL